MALLDQILSGGIGQIFKDIVGTFKLSPQAKAEFDAQLAQHQFELAKMDADLEAKLVDVAGANIQSEARFGDKFTTRARPSFLYLMEVIFLCNYVVFPIIKIEPIKFPDALFWLFGSGYLGYVGGRSWEKISGIFGK